MTEEQPTEMQFNLRNPWSRKLFIALARKYGLDPYRYHRQRYTTVMLRISKRLCEEVLWPEFVKLDEILVEHLNEITDRVVREAIHNDASEITIRQPLLGAE